MEGRTGAVRPHLRSQRPDRQDQGKVHALTTGRSGRAAPASGLIDGWAHCGIRRFRPIDDVLDFLDAIDCERAVIVQPLGDTDNDYLIEVAGAHRDRVRAVGVVALDDPDRKGALDRLAAAGCAGVRITAADLVADASFAGEASDAGLAIAVHAPDGVSGLVAIGGIVGSLDRPVIVAHLGMPVVSDGTPVRGAEILDLAVHANIHVLLSGLAMACPYPYEPLHQLVRDVVTRFGPDRVMWGSNYPLSEAADTKSDLALIATEAFGLTPEENFMITSKTACNVWFDW